MYKKYYKYSIFHPWSCSRGFLSLGRQNDATVMPHISIHSLSPLWISVETPTTQTPPDPPLSWLFEAAVLLSPGVKHGFTGRRGRRIDPEGEESR